MRRGISLAVVLAGVGVLAAAAPADAHPDRSAARCPGGYALTELHVYGQRIEHGIDPVTHQGTQEIEQNDPDATPADHRYAVALACVRPLTDAERNAEYYGRSTSPVLYPLEVR